MILGGISSWGKYKHTESGRICEVRDSELQVKAGSSWRTYVSYVMDDATGATFAVPLDDFRKRFERIET